MAAKKSSNIVELVKALLRRQSKNDEEDLHQEIREIQDCGPNAFAVLAQIMIHEADERLNQQAVILLFTVLRDESVPRSISQKAKSEIQPVLLETLKDKTVPDEKKLMVGPLLELCGYKLSDESYMNYFEDFEKATRGIADIFSKDELGLAETEDLVEGMGLYATDESETPTQETIDGGVVAAVELIKPQPLAGSIMACMAAMTACDLKLENDYQSKLFELVSEFGGTHGRWFLSVLAQQPGRGDDFSKQAAEVAAEMGKKGVNVEVPRLGKFSHGILSGVDGMGSRSMILFYHNEGEMDGMALLLNDEVGIKDFWCMWGTASGADDAMRSRQDIPTVPCDISLAREIVGDALAIHAKKSIPLLPQTLLGWHMLGTTPLPVQPRSPRLGVYMLESIVRSPELVKNSGKLMDHPSWSSLINPSDEAYALMAAMKKRMKTKRNLAAKVIDSMFFDEFLALLETHGREALLRRMAVNLEIEALAGRAKLPQNKMACFTWVAISEKVVPFGSIPFVRALAEAEIEMMAQNIEMGFRSQKEANARALELDIEMHKLDTELDWIDPDDE